MELTTEQLGAVADTSERIAIIAGPGAGKTATIVARVKHLIDSGVEPGGIGVVTFTRRAAKVLSERLGYHGNGVLIGTFHSVFMECLRRAQLPLHVIQPEDADLLVDHCAELVGVAFNNGSGYTYHKNSRASYRKRIKAFYESNTPPDPLTESYLSRLAMTGSVDYDGILYAGLQLAKGGHLVFLKHLIVDETQDNDKLQWDIINTLSSKGTNVTIVGQGAQCIYRWRGAYPEKMGDGTWVTHNLTKSFRCQPDVLAAINRSPVADIEMETDGSGDSISIIDQPIDAIVRGLLRDMYDPTDIAVLARYNDDVDYNIQVLTQAGLPVATTIQAPRGPVFHLLMYLANPTESLRHRVVMQLEPYRNLLADPVTAWIMGPLSHGVCAKMCKNWLARCGVLYGPAEILNALPLPAHMNSEVEYYTHQFTGETLDSFELASSGINDLELTPTPGITVVTMHAAKGMEFPAVVITNAEATSRKPTDDDRRLMYVAMSRPSERLIIACRNPSTLVTELLQPEEVK